MAEEKKIPEIRFKEFSGEWNQCDLGEVGGLKNGMNFGKEAMGHGYPFVNLQNVFGKNTVNNTNLELAVSTEKQRKEYSLEKGDVLFIRSSVKPEGVGEAALVPKDFKNTTYSGFIIRFRPNVEMNGNFNRFVYSTSSIRKQILTGATSSANTNINQDTLKKIQLILPKITEQTKIGNYFQQLDSLITLHQDKHDKLLNVKKAMLEKMFPKKGADVPEIRFKGFSDKWEERELGVEVDFFSGLTYSPSNVIKEGGTFVLRSSNVKNGEIVFTDNVYVNSDVVNSENVKVGDIIIVVRNGSRSLIGKHAQVKENMNNTVIGAFMTGIHSEQSAFINSLLDTVQFNKEIEKNLGATINQITNGAFKKMLFMFPTPDEQKIIGSYFQQLDTLLTLHQTELEKLKNIKKACLDKMFV